MAKQVSREGIIKLKIKGVPRAEAQMQGLRDELQSIGAAVEEMAADAREANTIMTAAMEETAEAAGETAKETREVKGEVEKLNVTAQAMEVATKFLAIVEGAKIAFAAIEKVGRAIGRVTTHAASIEGIRKSFSTLSESVAGEESAEAMRTLQEETGGLASQTDLASAANAAWTANIEASTKELGRYFDAVIRVARATGVDAADAIKRAGEALRRGTDENIRALGVTFRLETAMRNFADAQGKASEDVTNAERRMLLLRKGSEALEDQLQKLGLSATPVADATDRLSAAWTDLKDRFAEVLTQSPGLINAMTSIANTIADVTVAVAPLVDVLGDLLGLIVDVAATPFEIVASLVGDAPDLQSPRRPVRTAQQAQGGRQSLQAGMRRSTLLGSNAQNQLPRVAFEGF